MNVSDADGDALKAASMATRTMCNAPDGALDGTRHLPGVGLI
jgi:hypothetical protein